jgi:hypothetical protein
MLRIWLVLTVVFEADDGLPATLTSPILGCGFVALGVTLDVDATTAAVVGELLVEPLGCEGGAVASTTFVVLGVG